MRRKITDPVWLVVLIAWLFVISALAMFAEGYIPKTIRHLLLATLIIGPLAIFGEAILEMFLHVIAYAIGRTVLPFITFGRLRAETFDDELSFPWHGIRKLPDGTRVLSGDATSFFGLLVLALGIAGLFYIYF